MVECLSDVSNLCRTRRISTEKTDNLFAAQNSGDQNSGLRISGVSCRSHHTPPSFSWSKGRPGPGGCQRRAAGAPGFAWSQILDSLLDPGKVVTMRSTAGTGAGGAASRWSSREARIRGQIRIPTQRCPTVPLRAGFAPLVVGAVPLGSFAASSRGTAVAKSGDSYRFHHLCRRAVLHRFLSRAAGAARPQASARRGFQTGEEGRVAERAARARVAPEALQRRLFVRRRQQRRRGLARPPLRTLQQRRRRAQQVVPAREVGARSTRASPPPAPLGPPSPGSAPHNARRPVGAAHP